MYTHVKLAFASVAVGVALVGGALHLEKQLPADTKTKIFSCYNKAATPAGCSADEKAAMSAEQNMTDIGKLGCVLLALGSMSLMQAAQMRRALGRPAR